MKYINRGKRDILIFPQFDNIDEIEKIRKQYNEQRKCRTNMELFK